MLALRRWTALTAFVVTMVVCSSGEAGLDEGLAAQLSPTQMQQAAAVVSGWKVGQATPAAPTGAQAADGSSVKPARDRCSATGQMGGTKFTATHCAVSLLQDQNSVAIWFNEDPITPAERDSFQTSSYAENSKGGKPRTMLTIMFCPGGGKPSAATGAVKSMDFSTSHARSPLDGVQWVVEAGKDFRVEKMTGDIKPGATLAGKVAGRRDQTTWNLEFDVTLPTKDAAAGMSCN